MAFRTNPITSRSILTCLVLFISAGAFSQDLDTNAISGVEIVLKDGSDLVLNPDDQLTIGHGIETTLFYVTKPGVKKDIIYKAEDLQRLIFTRNGISDTSYSHQISKSEWIMIAPMVEGENVTLYRSPNYGTWRKYYIRKKGDPFVSWASNNNTQFQRNFKDCPLIVEKYINSSKKVKVGSTMLPEEAVLDIINIYNEKCGKR